MGRHQVDTPHSAENRASLDRRMRTAGVMPRTLDLLLEWYVSSWADELPMRLHQAGRQRTPPGNIVRADLSVAHDPGGADRTGAPRLADEWRRYLENSDREVNEDGSFVRPIHAALSYLAGRRQDGRHFMARYLLAVAFAGGNWRHVASRMGINEHVAEVYTHEALRRLWLRYDTKVREIAA